MQPSAAANPGTFEELRNAFEDVSEALYMPQEEVRRIDKQAIDNLFPRIPLSNFRGKDATGEARRVRRRSSIRMSCARWTPPRAATVRSSSARSTWATCGKRPAATSGCSA